MSYSTEAVILVGRRRLEIEDLLDEAIASDIIEECFDGIIRVAEYDADNGYYGYVFDDHDFTQDKLEYFIATRKEDFKRETGLDAELFLLASWS